MTALPLVLAFHTSNASAENAIGDDLFAGLNAISTSELRDLRGGFKLGPFDASIGLEISTIAKDIKVKTKISTDAKGLVKGIKTEVLSIVDNVVDKNKNGKSFSVSLDDPETVDVEGSLTDIFQTTPIINVSKPEDSTTTKVDLPATVIPPVSVEVSETPIGKSPEVPEAGPSDFSVAKVPDIDVVDPVGPLATDNLPPDVDSIGEVDTRGLGEIDRAVSVEASSTSTTVEISDEDGGVTKIVHGARGGQQAFIENSANDISISQTYGLNLHLKNFSAITTMAKARRINSSIQSSVLLGLLK